MAQKADSEPPDVSISHNLNLLKRPKENLSLHPFEKGEEKETSEYFLQQKQLLSGGFAVKPEYLKNGKDDYDDDKCKNKK